METNDDLRRWTVGIIVVIILLAIGAGVLYSYWKNRDQGQPAATPQEEVEVPPETAPPSEDSEPPLAPPSPIEEAPVSGPRVSAPLFFR